MFTVRSISFSGQTPIHPSWYAPTVLSKFSDWLLFREKIVGQFSSSWSARLVLLRKQLYNFFMVTILTCLFTSGVLFGFVIDFIKLSWFNEHLLRDPLEDHEH